MNKNGLFLPYNLDLSALNVQANLLNVWSSKQEFGILRLFELVTQAGLKIGLDSFFRIINVDCVSEKIFDKITL